MNPAICTGVNRIGNVDVDATTGAVRSAQAPQTIVTLVSVNDGRRTDVTIANPPPELAFEPGESYELAIAAAPAAAPPPPAP